MNREERRRGARRGEFHLYVTCVQVEPVGDGKWVVTAGVHAGDDVHDTAACVASRSVMVELVEDIGRCVQCRELGVVLCEVGDDALVTALCVECVGVQAQLVLREAMDDRRGVARGMREN